MTLIDNFELGSITEYQNNTTVDSDSIHDEIKKRANYFKSQGIDSSGRAVLFEGNSIGFFLDLLALWSLGVAVIPIPPQTPRFEAALESEPRR